ncbi:hypothetical protein [Pseudobdellovibrio exovorus]|uniref:KTSC domain-containing protein n=1 Tax=Pseudobdellovibrio exovorus JSS TaxID=1184267 RepID=M4VBJ0_9BACT|nr:hypothetical protein [Pseudobdellovibrio exovorus]AGH95391.1 hypothetical protein A11Q_1175 [Pseudobdellovibrio exovorus JSS]
MELYRNTGGDSGIVGYEIGTDSIVVKFRDGAVYLYDYTHTGVADVEHMKQLALSGSGLNSFISRAVRKRFARKIR